jgi:hypothetical protein
MSKNDFDLDKLESFKKLTLKKTETKADPEGAVQAIHTKPKEKERVKRVTIDLPYSTYVEIRKKIIEEEKTLKDYFLDLAVSNLE